MFIMFYQYSVPRATPARVNGPCGGWWSKGWAGTVFYFPKRIPVCRFLIYAFLICVFTDAWISLTKIASATWESQQRCNTTETSRTTISTPIQNTSGRRDKERQKQLPRISVHERKSLQTSMAKPPDAKTGKSSSRITKERKPKITSDDENWQVRERNQQPEEVSFNPHPNKTTRSLSGPPPILPKETSFEISCNFYLH